MRLYTPLCRRSISRLVLFLLFRRFWAFWAYSSCPDALVTFSSTAPAHLHATRVAVYPALFSSSPPSTFFFTFPPLFRTLDSFFQFAAHIHSCFLLRELWEWDQVKGCYQRFRWPYLVIHLLSTFSKQIATKWENKRISSWSGMVSLFFFLNHYWQKEAD